MQSNWQLLINVFFVHIFHNLSPSPTYIHIQWKVFECVQLDLIDLNSDLVRTNGKDNCTEHIYPDIAQCENEPEFRGALSEQNGVKLITPVKRSSWIHEHFMPFMNCSWTAHESLDFLVHEHKFMKCSWTQFMNSSWTFQGYAMFITCSWCVHELCSQTFHELGFMN